jgi:site-specific DNA recombinase
MFGDNNGAYRRDLIRAVARKVELLSPTEARNAGRPLRTLATTNGVETAALDVPGFVPGWRPLSNEADHYEYAIVLHRISRSDKGQKRSQPSLPTQS